VANARHFRLELQVSDAVTGSPLLAISILVTPLV
jgi:hypothetical protein